MPTRPADHTLLLQGRRFPEARDLRYRQSTGAVQTASSLATSEGFERTAALNSMRDGPMDHGFGSGDGSCIDWHQRHVVRVFSALCRLAA